MARSAAAAPCGRWLALAVAALLALAGSGARLPQLRGRRALTQAPGQQQTPVEQLLTAADLAVTGATGLVNQVQGQPQSQGYQVQGQGQGYQAYQQPQPQQQYYPSGGAQAQAQVQPYYDPNAQAQQQQQPQQQVVYQQQPQQGYQQPQQTYQQPQQSYQQPQQTYQQPQQTPQPQQGSGPQQQQQEPQQTYQQPQQQQQAAQSQQQQQQPQQQSSNGPSPAADQSGSSGSDILSLHNELRSRHRAPALTWSGSLQQSAQAWASQLAASCAFEHSHSEGVGENLAAGHNNWGEVAQDWYNEIHQYDYQAANYSPGTGHATQMIWVDSREMGCATASSSSGNCWYRTVYACHYSPPGNVIGSFAQNVLPPAS